MKQFDKYVDVYNVVCGKIVYLDLFYCNFVECVLVCEVVLDIGCGNGVLIVCL